MREYLAYQPIAVSPKPVRSGGTDRDLGTDRASHGRQPLLPPLEPRSARARFPSAPRRRSPRAAVARTSPPSPPPPSQRETIVDVYEGATGDIPEREKLERPDEAADRGDGVSRKNLGDEPSM